MTRQLRHVTIPDHHGRIPGMGEEGILWIAATRTETLREAIVALARKILLADEEWCIWYAIQDELIDRKEWSDDLAITGGRSR